MLEMNINELATYFQVSISTLKSNFPKFRSKQLEKGYSITKRGKGESAIYEIEKVEPNYIPSYQLSTKVEFWKQDLPNEQWITTYYNKNFEVSNYARVRDKRDFSLRKASHKGKGYYKVSLDHVNYPLHRLVLLSFSPIDNCEKMTVDHIDGNRSNNILSNLRYASDIDNKGFMIEHRKEINKEITRILQNYTYEEVMEILKGIE